MGGLEKVGMVTGAVMCDVDGDQEKELVIVGKWMCPRIFKFKNGHFQESASNLNQLNGWWQTVAVGDVNGDGKEDLILGNIGENFNLRASQAAPLKIWCEDFDENGIMDKIITKTVDGRDKPVFMKRDIDEGLPGIKKQNLRNTDFAKKSIDQMFSKQQLEKALVKKIDFLSSVVAISQGNGNFTVQSLPFQLQLSSVKSVVCKDLNHDGALDLIIGGNEFNFQPQLGRLDANLGEVLINDGKGNFNVLSKEKSGLSLSGMMRDIVYVPIQNNAVFLFLRNDSIPVLYQLNNNAIPKQKMK